MLERQVFGSHLETKLRPVKIKKKKLFAARNPSKTFAKERLSITAKTSCNLPWPETFGQLFYV